MDKVNRIMTIDEAVKSFTELKDPDVLLWFGRYLHKLESEGWRIIYKVDNENNSAVETSSQR